MDINEKKELKHVKASHAHQRDEFLVHAFAEKVDPKQFHEMKKELENNFIKGNPNCKKTVQDSHAFISNYKLSRSNFQKSEKGKDHESLMFSQQGNDKNSNNDDNDNNNDD